MTPSEVNAFYEPKFNYIGIPAGILQRPVYDSGFPAYDTVTLLCVGIIIPHRIDIYNMPNNNNNNNNNTTNLPRNLQWKKFVYRLGFDGIMAVSLWPHFLVHPVHLYINLNTAIFSGSCVYFLFVLFFVFDFTDK